MKCLTYEIHYNDLLLLYIFVILLERTMAFTNQQISSLLRSSTMKSFSEHFKDAGALFYVVNPYDSLFKDVEDIPKPSYLAKVSKIKPASNVL